MVECNLAKVEVAGSNPVSRFKFNNLASSVIRFYTKSTPISEI